MKARTAAMERKSKETQIIAELNVDGTGQTEISTPIKILDHMLDLFAFHGRFDLKLDVKGDTDIDIHHTNEDIAIVLGKLFRKALDEFEGINRYGHAYAPMESTMGRCVVDLCGRPHYYLQTLDLTGNGLKSIKDQDNYSIKYLEHFIESFAKGLGATIHVLIENPDEDLHTCIETVFKSLGIALDQATQIDPRRAGAVPSTKGIID
jgi:imidazoleglycerol-phosphate dehydratase